MSYKRKTTGKVMDVAQIRLAAMTQIDADKARVIDYGDTGSTLTKADYQAQMTLYSGLIASYNKLLDQADTLKNNIADAETKLNNMSVGILAGGSAKFGRNSNEFQELGGTRIVDRKRPVRQPKKAA